MSCAIFQERYATLAIANRTCDPSLLFLYTFEEGQLNSSIRSTADVSWQNYLGDLVLSDDPARQNPWLIGQSGFFLDGSAETIAASSTRNATAVFDQIAQQNDGSFCLEAWIQSQALQTCTVFGFGTWTSLVGTSQGCMDGKNIAFMQSDWSVYFRVMGLDQVCEFSEANMGTTPTGLHHFVGCVDEFTESVFFYLDGELSFQGNAATSDFLSWSVTSRLMFGPSLDYKTGTTTWQGIVYLAAMYSRVLSATEVSNNYNAGLPNNLPVPNLMQQSCTAQAGANSTLSGLDLGATDVDQELIFELPYSNWLQPQNLTLAIVQLPDSQAGTLYLTLNVGETSLALFSSMLPVWLPDDNASFSLSFLNAPLSAAELLLPAYSVISAFAAFSFVANDGFANGPVAVVYIDLLITPALTSSSSSSSSSAVSSSPSAVSSSASGSSSLLSSSSSSSSSSSVSSGSSSQTAPSLSSSLSSSLIPSDWLSSSQRSSSSSWPSPSSSSSVKPSSSALALASSVFSALSYVSTSTLSTSDSSSTLSPSLSSSSAPSPSSFGGSSSSSSSPSSAWSASFTSSAALTSSAFSSSWASSTSSSSTALSSSSSSSTSSASSSSSSSPVSGSLVSSGVSSSTTAASSSSSPQASSLSSSSSDAGTSATWSAFSSSISSSLPPASTADSYSFSLSSSSSSSSSSGRSLRAALW